jgi:hypothetical protein
MNETGTKVRQWTVGDYYRMLHAGILAEDDKVETVAVLQHNPYISQMSTLSTALTSRLNLHSSGNRKSG